MSAVTNAGRSGTRIKAGETIVGLYPATKEENLEKFQAWRREKGR